MLTCIPPHTHARTHAHAHTHTRARLHSQAHHNVDTHTKPCKPMWSPQQANETYSQEQLCAGCVVWGSYKLCRSANQTECVRLAAV